MIGTEKKQMLVVAVIQDHGFVTMGHGLASSLCFQKRRRKKERNAGKSNNNTGNKITNQYQRKEEREGWVGEWGTSNNHTPLQPARNHPTVGQ
jgi:hypothetical protein